MRRRKPNFLFDEPEDFLAKSKRKIDSPEAKLILKWYQMQQHTTKPEELTDRAELADDIRRKLLKLRFRCTPPVMLPGMDEVHRAFEPVWRRIQSDAALVRASKKTKSSLVLVRESLAIAIRYGWSLEEWCALIAVEEKCEATTLKERHEKKWRQILRSGYAIPSSAVLPAKS